MSLLSPLPPPPDTSGMRFKPREALAPAAAFELPSPAEREMMTGLAAWMMRYSHIDEALGLLLCCRSLWPEDTQTLRLLAQALMQAGEWRKANAIFQEMEMAQSGPAEPKSMLARAVTFLHLRQAGEAAAYFGRYTAANNRKTGQSA
jgi:hypothetical protein